MVQVLTLKERRVQTKTPCDCSWFSYATLCNTPIQIPRWVNTQQAILLVLVVPVSFNTFPPGIFLRIYLWNLARYLG